MLEGVLSGFLRVSRLYVVSNWNLVIYADRSE